MTSPQDEQGGKPAKTGRRGFLKILAGGTILAASGIGLFAATRTPNKALEPWKLALGPSPQIDPRRVILSHAILAPNPHNRQPWIVDLKGENEIVLYCDLDRRLQHTDPYDRQITIGLGCFLELADITARELGLRAEINLFPDGENFPRLDQRPVAKIQLSPGESTTDPLFKMIFDRRSNKDPYDPKRSVPEDSVKQIIAAGKHGTFVGSSLEPGQVERLRSNAWSAMETELHTYRTAKESIDLLRIGKAEIEANPDGIDLGGALFDTLKALGLMNRKEFLDTSSSAFQQQIDAIREPFELASGFLYVKTSGNSRKDQIAAGRDYVRLNLMATKLGVAMQPWSQALQEFEEVKPYYARIREELGIASSETLQMFSRIGYGQSIAPSPRWAYETRIRNS
ncbi:MAG: nitroreductase family protein [Pseudomonadota bacterium]